MHIEPSHFELKIAVIGCGNWGKNHVRVLHQFGALCGVHDVNQIIAQKYGQQYHVPALSLAQILNDSKIHGVVIATPTLSHFELAVLCLEAGKHVLVEKPLARSIDEAKLLTALAASKHLILMVGHIHHYHAGFKALKTLRQQGVLGKIKYLYSNRLNFGKSQSEANIWWNFAPHDISMILSLLQKMPSSITAVGGNFLKQTDSDITHTYLNFPDGELAHIFVSWLHPYKEQKLVVIGEEAMAIFDDGKPWAEKLQIHAYPGKWADGMPRNAISTPKFISLVPEEPLQSELIHFLECIREQHAPITDGVEGCRVVEILSAAALSIEKNKTIHFQSENHFFAHPTVEIDADCKIGEGTKIWHYSHILKDTIIGKDCILGQNASIGPHVVIGNTCKIQNNVSIFEGVTLEDDVFIGPSVTFTNVNNPRAFINRKHEFRPTLVKKGATIGANATIICGHTLGEYSFVAAGSVVTKDVAPYALVVGNPAKAMGWVNQAGERVAMHPLAKEAVAEHDSVS